MKRRKEITLTAFILVVFIIQACQKQSEVPIVETKAAHNIYGTMAISGGTIVTSKSHFILQQGLCWSTDKNPTIDGDHTTEASVMGQFISVIENLKPGTDYYYRAYAISSEGVGYGTLLNFKTADENSYFIQLDSVRIKSLRTIYAYGDFNVHQANMPIKDYGFCWAYEKVPTVDDNLVVNVSGNYVKIGKIYSEKGVPVLIRAFFRTLDGRAFYGLTTITIVPKEFRVEKIDRITFRSARVNIVHAEQPNVFGVFLYWWEQSETPIKSRTFFVSQGTKHITYAFDLLPDRTYHVQPHAYFYDNNFVEFADMGDMATFSTLPLPDYGNGTLNDPYSVDGALYLGDMEDLTWVEGFMNGTHHSSGSNYEEPFTVTTNILIAERSDEIWRGNSILVNLPAGPIRDALNLMENPSNKGKIVKIYGKCSLTSGNYDVHVGTMNDVTDFVIVDD